MKTGLKALNWLLRSFYCIPNLRTDSGLLKGHLKYKQSFVRGDLEITIEGIQLEEREK